MSRVFRLFIGAVIFLLICLPVGCGDDAATPEGGSGHFWGPTKMVVTPDETDLRGVYLYVVNSQGDSICVIDTKTRALVSGYVDDNERTDVIWVGSAPKDIAITPDGSWVYVTDAVDGVLRKIEAHAPFRVTTTSIVAKSGRILIPQTEQNYRGPLAYITEPGTQILIQAALGADVVTATLDLPGTPAGMTVTPDGAMLLITTEQGDLVIVDTVNFEVMSSHTLNLEGRPGNLITDADGRMAFVLNNDPPQVQVVDLSDFSLTDDEIYFDIPLADLVLGVDGRYIYITSQTGKVLTFSVKFKRACGASVGRVFFHDQWPQSDPQLVDLSAYDCVTEDERWYVEYQPESNDWRVWGEKEREQVLRARANLYYVSDAGQVGFRIQEGERGPSEGDYFYFETNGGIEPIEVGLVPDGLAVTPYYLDDSYLIFVANTGNHLISLISSDEFFQIDAIN